MAVNLIGHHRSDPGVLIAGGGLAAQRAVETLRRNGYDGVIRVISDEHEAPYDRPPLSKEYLGGHMDDDALRFRGDDWYAARDVELLLGARAAALDPRNRELVLASGERLAFSQLLIATGGVPRRLPGTRHLGNVHELRNVRDARRLRDAIARAGRVVVIGAGFIGQEVASTAHGVGAEVTIVEAAPAPLAALLGTQLGHWFARLHREEGIDVHLSARIARFHGADAVRAVDLEGGPRIECDVVVVGIGTVPATAWVNGSGLDDGGIAVDAAGRTGIPGVFAAGDASKPFDTRRGAHVRAEHWEAAARQGANAARAMLALEVPPPPPPTFWSDQHGLRIQYVGEARGADAVAIDGDPGDRDFTATFTDHGRPIAALLVGRPHALPELRRQIEQARSTTQEGTAA
ncbi:MAG TPA: FAD-dependent oxidoreductase [Solirubrobacteraceae bacterium]|nr:FAD-dependent oxidoreductase [Solirubrobacteraceae bacterium]